MKKVIATLVTALFLYTGTLCAQTPIAVTDTVFKLPMLGEEFLYYGFAEGDQLLFSFEEQNGKDLKEIEIIEMPGTSRYKESKVRRIDNKTFNVPRTGIYQFRFANTVVLQKNCRLKIQRIAANEATRNFNTNVYWRIVYDTTYRNFQKKTLPAESYKTVSLLPAATYYIEPNGNGFKPLTLAVTLPDFTSEWYYMYAVTNDKAKAENLKSSLQLASMLRKSIAETGNLSFVDSLPVPAGSDTCRIYLLDQSNHEMFEERSSFRHFKEGTREHSAAGIVKIKTATFPNAYLGIRNPNAQAGIYVALEAVAIIAPEEVSESVEQQSVSVKARKEPYLKN